MALRVCAPHGPPEEGNQSAERDNIWGNGLRELIDLDLATGRTCESGERCTKLAAYSGIRPRTKCDEPMTDGTGLWGDRK